MKVVLSRKGFDGTAGGVPNAIMPDGRLVTFPIPGPKDPATYGDVVINGVPIGPIVQDLTGGRIAPKDRCHLDPDIDGLSRPRLPGWRPCFGQDHAAQSHLDRMGVTVGDLLLFFGWFRQIEETAVGWRYVPRAPDLHVIYGWLQVGEVVRLGRGGRPDPEGAFADHPHLHRLDHPSNTLYVSADWLGGLPLDLPGAGLFRQLSDSRVLTAPGQKNRSLWRLPRWMHWDADTTLSFHLNRSRWSVEEGTCLLQSVGRGQEFVLNCTDATRLTDWLGGLFGDLPSASLVQAATRGRINSRRRPTRPSLSALLPSPPSQ